MLPLSSQAGSQNLPNPKLEKAPRGFLLLDVGGHTGFGINIVARGVERVLSPPTSQGRLGPSVWDGGFD